MEGSVVWRWKADVLQSSGSQTVMCTRITWDLVKLQLLTWDTCVEPDYAFLVTSQVALQVQDHDSVARL